MSFSYTKTSSFTIVHARQLSSMVAADMHLCATFYGQPSEDWIRKYSEELAQLLNLGYVSEYEFGYKRDGKRVVCWNYAMRNGILVASSRPGKVFSYADVTGATYYNFLTPNAAWNALSDAARESIESTLPVQRGYPAT